MSLAVIVNLRARRGSESVGKLVRRFFPEARLALTRSPEEARAWIHDHLRPDPPSLLLAGGGDGTITGILNELRRQDLWLPAVGVLPLGTGNAWARVTGAPKKPSVALEQLAAFGQTQAPPLRPFHLVRVEGAVAPFAGTGWDAELVADFRAQLEDRSPGPARDAYAGLRGYLNAVMTRTIPRHLTARAPEVSVYNLGEDALTVNGNGNVVPLADGKKGALLYRGPASVAGSSTTPELGFGFRAFPFAEKVPGRISVRVYSAGVLEATRNAVRLWRGHHPMPKMHDFLLTRVRMEFDREVPFQVAGDLLGTRRAVEFELADERVQLLDWGRLSRLVAA
ncbi:MAG: diacylglycerol kinase [Myxococcaceae bacterium]|nr:diacylglycerol kinase [Myxococcaceae bacterium]MCI0671415.1 diacylglycerol kinase [Myxococcaceae bacterium]